MGALWLGLSSSVHAFLACTPFQELESLFSLVATNFHVFLALNPRFGGRLRREPKEPILVFPKTLLKAETGVNT